MTGEDATVKKRVLSLIDRLLREKSGIKSIFYNILMQEGKEGERTSRAHQ